MAGDYFMAAHTLKWPVIGLALFATNISCVHLVSLAQSGYDTGLLNGNFEWMAAFTLILLGFFFAPFYLKSKVATLPDFLEKRYCRECRDWLAFVSIIAAIIFHIAFPLATGWLILHDIFGIEKWTCILLMCALTGIYTVVGGLAAVAITETIQTVVLLLGAFVITGFAWQKTGGWGGMTATLDTANAAAHGLTDGQLLSMLRPHGDASGMPWYSIFLGYPVLGIWYWCADQTIVQRVLGARSENDARVGSIFCGLIKILPVFIFIVPGLMLYTGIKQGSLEGVSQVRLIQTVTGADGNKEQLVAITGDTGGGRIDPIRVKEGETIDLSQLPIQRLRHHRRHHPRPRRAGEKRRPRSSARTAGRQSLSVEGSLCRHDPQAVARRRARRAGRRADGRADGQSLQRLELDRHHGELRHRQTLPPDRPATSNSSSSAASPPSARLPPASPWCRCLTVMKASSMA